jgi:integrase
MARKSRDERLDTRTARLRLTPRREPYWRTIQEGRAIGYRRAAGGRAGTWIARHYDPAAAVARQYRSLGAADDFMDGDGADTLTFTQAQERARAWFGELSRAGGKVVAPLTVKEAIRDYLADYTARKGTKALSTMQAAIDAHILPAFGERKVGELSATAIKTWHRALAAAPRRLRTKQAAPAKSRPVPADDAPGQLSRKATANRVLTILKAALNLAFRDGKVSTDDAWRRVQPFQQVDAAKVRYLTDEEGRRLVNACPIDLRAIVTAALVTGCRYGELIELRAGDFDPDTATLHIRQSKAGKGRTAPLTDDAARFFSGAAAGKASGALLLLREDATAWGKSHQFRRIRDACAGANITPAVSFHILRHTFASRLARQRVPMNVIAAALGNSEAICSKHYAHLAPGYVADTIRQHAGGMGIVPAGNLAPVRADN